MMWDELEAGQFWWFGWVVGCACNSLVFILHQLSLGQDMNEHFSVGSKRFYKSHIALRIALLPIVVIAFDFMKILYFHFTI